MKKILLLHMLVFVSATLPISSVASDEVETLKCTIIADAITGNTLYAVSYTHLTLPTILRV